MLVEKEHSFWQIDGTKKSFPKGTKFQQVSRYEVAVKQDLLNDRPRKRLNYQTPSEVFQKQCSLALHTWLRRVAKWPAFVIRTIGH